MMTGVDGGEVAVGLRERAGGIERDAGAVVHHDGGTFLAAAGEAGADVLEADAVGMAEVERVGWQHGAEHAVLGIPALVLLDGRAHVADGATGLEDEVDVAQHDPVGAQAWHAGDGRGDEARGGAGDVLDHAVAEDAGRVGLRATAAEADEDGRLDASGQLDVGDVDVLEDAAVHHLERDAGDSGDGVGDAGQALCALVPGAAGMPVAEMGLCAGTEDAVVDEAVAEAAA